MGRVSLPLGAETLLWHERGWEGNCCWPSRNCTTSSPQVRLLAQRMSAADELPPLQLQAVTVTRVLQLGGTGGGRN